MNQKYLIFFTSNVINSNEGTIKYIPHERLSTSIVIATLAIYALQTVSMFALLNNATVWADP